MTLKEKMMDSMMDKMSMDEKMEMMDKMMDKFFSDMTAEEKQRFMSEMMGKMMKEGNVSMMDMMKNMMSGSIFGEGDDFNPMEMCKKMMSSMSQNSEMAEFATPELRNLFNEWIRQIEDEILQYVDKKKSIDTKEIASHFNLSEESISYILGNLAQKGKVRYST